MSKDNPHRIEITAQEMEALIERGDQRSFVEQDYPIVVAVLRNYFSLDHVVQENAHTILRLVKMLFGHQTEKAKQVLKGSCPKDPSPNATTTTEEAPQGKVQRAWSKRGFGLRRGSESRCSPFLLQSGRPMPALSQRKALPLL